ncbi:phosphoinositide 3-kinase regulatory subunit 5 [Ambystoma mexicanum]|uniref:phosphoinositide 3-kinase regulatory subunit 5 n=1 Tax=Ambystoma mexicanum TaxID=8296 RepID=UPI0037E8BCC1
MEHTSCTEDRIHHALERCLHGLSRSTPSSATWTAGLCLNCWSLEELVSRDAGNYLILVEKILQRTQQVQENCEYHLVTPLALMFYSAVLCAPYFTPSLQLLQQASKIYHSFLTWPLPYCNIYQELLSFIDDELKAPGVSFQRLVRAEQGLTTKNLPNRTFTVLLVNPTEVPDEFVTVADKMSSMQLPRDTAYRSLIKHIYQSNFGTAYDLESLCGKLQAKTMEELVEIYSESTEALEMAAITNYPAKATEWLKTKLQDIGQKAGLLKLSGAVDASHLQTIPLPTAQCLTYRWDSDNFDILNDILLNECDIQGPLTLEVDVEEEEDEDVETDGCYPERDSIISNLSNMSHNSLMSSTLSISSKDSMRSFVSSLSNRMDSGYVDDSDESTLEPEVKEVKAPRLRNKFTNKICKLIKSKSNLALKRDKLHEVDLAISCPTSSLSVPLRRAESLHSAGASYQTLGRSRRAHSLPQHTLNPFFNENHQAQSVFFKRRPFLSCDEDGMVSTLRVIVFGSDRISGKVARAYSNLRLQESKTPLLTRYFRLQFFYVPVKRSCTHSTASLTNASMVTDSHHRPSVQMNSIQTEEEESTNNISHYIGVLDPWYERNVLGLMNLSTTVLCQQSTKREHESSAGVKEPLPILADMMLYYCRFATRPVLLQLYQAELTFHSGEKRTEVFIHSLEMGHSAATRAIRASGPGSKRLGIYGDREAVPLTLQIVHSKTTISGRNRWTNGEKVCTSVNLSKACRQYEEIGDYSKMECLNLTVSEVIKRQNSKSKKSVHQLIAVSQMKVDKVQVIAMAGCTFAICLDQDERKILQCVTRCEVSPCYKPDSGKVSKTRRAPPYDLTQDHSECGSLLCLPIATFSGALP